MAFCSSLVIVAVFGHLLFDGTPVGAIYLEFKPDFDPFWALAGEETSLTCIAENENHAPTLAIEGKDIPKEFLTTDVGDGYASVTFRKVMESSDTSPSYSCGFHNEVISKDVVVFSVESRTVNLSIGQDTTLSLLVEPSDIDYFNFTWHKGGKQLEEDPDFGDRIKLTNRNLTISISDSKPSDSAEYTLKIYNFNTMKVQTFTKEFGIQGKPFFYHEDVTKLKEVSKTGAIFNCPFGGYPEPQVFWFRGSNEIEPNSKYVISITTFEDKPSLQLEMLGAAAVSEASEISCVAENSMGKATLTFSSGTRLATSWSILALTLSATLFSRFLHLV